MKTRTTFRPGQWSRSSSDSCCLPPLEHNTAPTASASKEPSSTQPAQPSPTPPSPSKTAPAPPPTPRPLRPPLRPATTSRLTANASASPHQPPHPRACGETLHLDFHLALATVTTNVEVGDDDDGVSLDSDHGIGTHTLTQKDIQQLADDPDDFQRQLQILAAANGGAPGAARIHRRRLPDSSALPPKAPSRALSPHPIFFPPNTIRLLMLADASRSTRSPVLPKFTARFS